MATVITLDDDVQAKVESMVRSGRFASTEDAIRASVMLLDDDLLDDELTPEDLAAIDEGLADIDAGRVVDAETVFERLTAKYSAMVGPN